MVATSKELFLFKTEPIALPQKYDFVLKIDTDRTCCTEQGSKITIGSTTAAAAVAVWRILGAKPKKHVKLKPVNF